MNELSKLSPRPGSQKPRTRIGRGPGSGKGKTAGRGQKGQKARSSRIRPGMEGGQIPIIRRSPKFGFTNFEFKTRYQIVNVADLAEFEEGTVVTPELLAEAGLVRKATERVKVLGDGELAAKLTVRAHKFSKSAAEKITAKGGTAEVLAR